MRVQLLSTWLLCGLSVSVAVPHANNNSFDPQKAASRQLSIWQNEMGAQVAKHFKEQQTALKNITAPAGCTMDKMIYRQEW